MSTSSAYRLEDSPVIERTTRAHSGVRGARADVTVELADAAQLEMVRPLWIDLLARSDVQNPFMDPALVGVAARTNPAADHRALLAWKPIDGERKLVGIWAFAVGYARKSALPIRVIRIPAYAHGFLATPVIDRDCLDEALDAMLERIGGDPELPKIITLDMMSTDAPVYAALMRVLHERGCMPRIFAESRRPKLVPNADGKAYLERTLSSSTRKKLRQHRRKLSDKGTLASVIVTEPAAMRGALEEFLTMEAAGWKGRQGTALLSKACEADFMRGALATLAELGCASIHALYLDGRPISMQIVARAGSTAFTWKTTYDEAFQDFSPGMLLLEDYTAAFLADKTITSVDSCSLDDTGFMSAWDERQPVADLWIDAQRGGSVMFRVLCSLQKTYRDLRATAKNQYQRWQKSRKR